MIDKSKTYNWAILGCGHIAEKFALELQELPQAKLYGAVSRNIDNAQKFASQFGFEKAFGSYDEMVKDPNVDVVYIATPHTFHLEHTLLCLNHKKAVLCEKAFAINSKEVQQMITASKENNTFLMEAFWVVFTPKFKKVFELTETQDLGKLKFVKSDFHFLADYNPNSRLFNIELGGGSLLDIGIYPVFTALMFLGMPRNIKTTAHFAPTGSEESISMLFEYDEGATAVLSSSFKSHEKIETELCFEKGIIKYDRDQNDPIVLIKKDFKEEIIFEKCENAGYKYEALHVMDCLDKNLIESPVLTNQVSLNLMGILDAVRKKAGVVYPNHDLI